MTTDLDLLRDYTRQKSEKAFSALVTRHLELVFSTALRQVRSSQLAEEIAQSVFIDLARNANRLRADTVLASWLYAVTRRTALNVSRSESRRMAREQIAVELAAMKATSSDWTQIEPLLDDAMDALDETERAAILLRYFENKSLREVGSAFGIGEDAAQKRVSRAVERLREFFSKRNMTIGASGLAVLISANAVQAAPIGLAASVIAASIATTGSSSLFLYKIMSVSKLKLAVAALAITAIPVAWQWNEHRESRELSTKMEARFASAQNEFTSLQTEIEKLRDTSTRLGTSLVDAENAANLSAEKSKTFSTWKEQLRERLISPNYEWPTDSPFVRIPKSVLSQLRIDRPISPLGTINQNERELLGLTPQEREQMESALQTHLAKIDELITTQLYETNKTAHFSIPKTAIASKVWGVPALGEVVKTSGDELRSEWKNISGAERWKFLGRQMEYSSSDVQTALGFDTDVRGQEFAVWIGDDKTIFYGWSGQNSTFTSGGGSLAFFLPGIDTPAGMGAADDIFNSRTLPQALTRPALEWIREEAVTQLGKKGAQ